jgi:hypothetical protein
MTAGRQVVLASALYPLDSVAVAERAFAGLCTITSRAVEVGLEVSILPAPGAPPEIAGEFLNYLLCAALEARLAELSE